MANDTFHIRIKKSYVIELINDLIEAKAIELIPKEEVELIDEQKETPGQSNSTDLFNPNRII